jgi:ubiquinone/menaquinone biosynthesis C-methylase UbiE
MASRITNHESRSASRPWYIQAFGKDYLDRYAHRSDTAARSDIPFLISALRARKGARILDLCCGAGRYSRALAKAGYSVAAVDLSAELLQAAARQSHRKTCYARVDMRRLPYGSGSLDGAVNLFTSFGYFLDEENARVLKEAARVLKPGARLILDFFNREFVLRNMIPRTQRNAGGCLIEEHRWLDRRNGRLNKSTVYCGRHKRNLRESVRAYTPSELEKLFRRAGFSVIGRYGSLHGERFDRRKSQRCVIVGEKCSTSC